MLEAFDLVKLYPVRHSDAVVRALTGVSVRVERGQTVGIVGESGCGKSTLAKLLVRLEEPTSGVVVMDGVELTGLSGTALRAERRRVQMVFQDPYASLNPRQRVGAILAEVLATHKLRSTATERKARVVELLDMVGLSPVFAGRFSHELSGGQRQRVGIARALAVEPAYLVLDEPVSALDVSVRAEVMNLLARLQRELDLGYLFISHDMAMVRQIADTVGVMYLGTMVETGGWREVLDGALHPYTQGLREAVPVPDPTLDQPLDETVTGEVPNPADPPSGCTFHPRCPLAVDSCRVDVPELVDLPGGHRVACPIVTGPLLAGVGASAAPSPS